MRFIEEGGAKVIERFVGRKFACEKFSYWWGVMLCEPMVGELSVLTGLFWGRRLP